MPKLRWIAMLAAFFPVLSIAQPFYHSAYITGQPRTEITFELDGSGQTVSVLPDLTKTLPANEYINQGFYFDRNLYWVNDSGSDFDAAQAIGGSLQIAIPGSSKNDFYISFDVFVRSFGFWVVQWTGADSDVTFEIWGESGLLDTVVFTGLAVDGQIGIAEYGFLGYTADELILDIHVTKDAAILDNFIFSRYPVELPDPDIDDSGQVNVGDLVLFVEQWLGIDCGRCEEADLNTDGNITLLDLATLAAHWLQ